MVDDSKLFCHLYRPMKHSIAKIVIAQRGISGLQDEKLSDAESGSEFNTKKDVPLIQ